MRKDKFWKNKKVLITGSHGFIGSHLYRRLNESGAKVTGFDYKCGGDISDIGLIDFIMKNNKINVVFHLAAQPFVSIAKENPISTFEANVNGTLNVLECARKHKNIKSIVVASSSKVIDAVGIYDTSKKCVEMVSKMYASNYNLPVALARCSNIYGPGDLNFENRIIPKIIKEMHHNRPLILDRTDGSNKRDFLYIDDAINGYLLLAKNLFNWQKNPKKRINGQVYDFCSGDPMSIKELVNIIYYSNKYTVLAKYGKRPSNEVGDNLPCNKYTKKVLGWTAKNKFEDAIDSVVNWYSNYLQEEE